MYYQFELAQRNDFTFKPLTANDPAFFSSDVHIIDHVRDPKKLGQFTDMLVQEVQYLSPETTKLKAAIAMKKAEISNYGQKFFMPNAKMSLEYQTQFGRNLPYENAGHNQMIGANSAASSAAATAAYAGAGGDAAVAAGAGGELLHGAEGLGPPLLGDGESRRVAYAGDGVEGRADGPVLDDEPGAL